MSLEQMSNKILLSAFAFIFIGLIAAGYFSRKLSIPLKSLQLASEQVGRGDFGFQVTNNQHFQSVELKNTIGAFNEMSNKIERLQAENEVLQKQAQFSELSEITRGLAHTIRNPLNTLNLAIDELMNASDEATKSNLNSIAKQQVHRIDKWVRSMMDIMSSDTSLVELVDVRELLQSTINEISFNSTQKTSIRLEFQPESSTGEDCFLINAVRPELKSLFHSLIANAIESMPEKETQGKENIVSVLLKSSDKNLIVSISDHGKGIDPEIKSKLFSPHNTNKTYGSGMGLYLAHRIVTLKYSGNIEIDNNLNSLDESMPGTTVNLTLNSRV